MTGTTPPNTIATKKKKRPLSRKDLHRQRQQQQQQQFKKAKMTKDDRRAKYTQLARDREDKKRQRFHTSHLVCYQCREKGHAVADCPLNTTTKSGKQKKQQATRICFYCGSTDHSLSACPQRTTDNNNDNNDDLPFCHCFICHQKGHLSSKCPSNTHGIFVNGGECKQCGSNLHTSKRCPQRQDLVPQREKSVTGLPDVDGDALLLSSSSSGTTGHHGDDMPEWLYKSSRRGEKQPPSLEKASPKKGKRRVVNF